MRIRKKAKIALFKCIAGFNQHNKNNEKINLIDIHKILIIRQDNRIGNILFTTSLVELIKQQTSILPDIIVGEKFHDLLRNNQSIGNIYIYKQKQFIKTPWQFLGFLSKLRRTKYDLVIDCKSSFSFNNALLTLFSSAKQKIGFSNSLSSRYLNFSLDITNNDEMHESLFLAQPFIHYFNLNCDVPGMKYMLTDMHNRPALTSICKVVGIHIGGRNDKSICPKLVNHICSELQGTNTEILIIYGPDEIEKARLILDRQNQVKVFPRSMDHLAQTINNTDVFITPDTGPLHIASALNKRIIAVFNTDNWIRYGPRSEQPSLTIHTQDLCASTIVNMIQSLTRNPSMPNEIDVVL